MQALSSLGSFSDCFISTSLTGLMSSSFGDFWFRSLFPFVLVGDRIVGGTVLTFATHNFTSGRLGFGRVVGRVHFVFMGDRNTLP